MTKKKREKNRLPESVFFSEEFISCMEKFFSEYPDNPKSSSIETLRLSFFAAKDLCNYSEKDFLCLSHEDAVIYIKYLQLKKYSFNSIRKKVSRLERLGKYIESECSNILSHEYKPVFSIELFRSVMGTWVPLTDDKDTLIGKTFGQLTVKSYISGPGNEAICTCQCSCDKEFVVREKYLLNHYVTHCGDYSVHKRGIDLRSEKYGFLLVLERDRMSKTRKAKWFCLCGLCGRVVSVFADNLKSGNTVSCGCGQHYGRELLKEMLEDPEKYCKYW